MAQYPFRITFADEERIYPYVVKANDRGQALKRAKRQFQEDHGREAPVDADGRPSRLMELTPKQQNGEFFPRIDGTVVSSEPRATASEAVEAALAFLNERSARP